MTVGTAKHPRYIHNNIKHLTTYHAITGYDTTSQLSGHGKKSTGATYIRQPFTDMSEGALLTQKILS